MSKSKVKNTNDPFAEQFGLSGGIKVPYLHELPWNKVLVKIREFVKKDIIKGKYFGCSTTFKGCFEDYINSLVEEKIKDVLDEFKKEFDKKLESRLLNVCPNCGSFNIDIVYERVEILYGGPPISRPVDYYICKSCKIHFG